jgi:hypothetical protein
METNQIEQTAVAHPLEFQAHSVKHQELEI